MTASQRTALPWAVVAVACCALVAYTQATILVGDADCGENLCLYSLDTGSSALDPAVTFFFNLSVVDHYIGGCVDPLGSVPVVHLVMREPTGVFRVDTVSFPDGKLLSSGGQFDVPSVLEDVKCDTQWHTVILASLLEDDSKTLIINSVVPESGTVTQLAAYACDIPHQIFASGSQAYNSEDHIYYAPNLVGTKPALWGIFLMVILESNSTNIFPWEEKQFEFESGTYVEGINGLLGLNLLRGSGAVKQHGHKSTKRGTTASVTLDVWNFAKGTNTAVGNATEILYTWGVGSAATNSTYYVLGGISSQWKTQLLSWDIHTGAFAASNPIPVSAYRFLNIMHP